MWPFFSQQSSGNDSPPAKEQSQRKPLQLDAMVAQMGDISDLADNDAALKFWLPEPAEQAIKEICDRNGDNLSSAIRQLLIIHCYGLYAYFVMLDTMEERYQKSLVGRQYGRLEPPKFSRRPRDTDPTPNPSPSGPGSSTSELACKKRSTTYWVVELGKNVAPIKLWVPKRVKHDLGLLAVHTKLTTSNYVREIVISRILGHGMLPKRPEMVAVPSSAVEAWIDDRPEAWKQVSKEAFTQYKIGEERE